MSAGPADASLPQGPPPAIEQSEAGVIAARLWGVEGTVKSLESERDQNFRIYDGTRAFVLKIAHMGEERGLLEAQNRVLARVAAAAPGLVPEVVPTLAGEGISTLEIHGGSHLVRLLTYLHGIPVGEMGRHSPSLEQSIGGAIATVDSALEGFDDEALHRDFYWDLAKGPEIVAAYSSSIEDARIRSAVEGFAATFAEQIAPALEGLPSGLVHGDANENNLLAANGGVEDLLSANQRVTGVLDFGDMVWSRQVHDPAIAAAYAMAGRGDPLAAAANVVRGYHRVRPLSEHEVGVLFPLACMRLCQSICLAMVQTRRDPQNLYLSISQEAIRETLPRALEIAPGFATYVLRQACGLPPVWRGPAVDAWLRTQRVIPVIVPPAPAAWRLLELDPASSAIEPAEPGTAGVAPGACGVLPPRPGEWLLGRHGEVRYLGPPQPGAEPSEATIHLGLDLFAPAGTPVRAPLAARFVQAFSDPAAGGRATVVLEHDAAELGPVWTIYRGLDQSCLRRLRPGEEIRAGQGFAEIGAAADQVGPSVHLQLSLDLLEGGLRFPILVTPSLREVWAAISPDPSPLLGLAPAAPTRAERSRDETLERRRRTIAPNLSLAYEEPLKILRGEGAHLFDDAGRPYLDCVNNIAHVGHSNPRVVRALSAQARVLNTNTRYLHDNLTDYAEALLARLPERLSVCFFTCSGSEANDLALRIARTVTGRGDIVVIDGAYHGNTAAAIDASPYKYGGRGGAGEPASTHSVPIPDPYRGRFRGSTEETAAAYAGELDALLAELAGQGSEPAAFIAESVLGCGGQVEFPPGYLRRAFESVRAAGGLCIADEVQVGFGRLGDRFWGFETQEAVPDIVTMGKPIGNGHPMAAVATTAEVAAAFDNGMEFMSSFGGNPVSCAVGLAVLEEIDERGLQQNAREVGARLLGDLRALAPRQPLIGDVRGRGLFLGVELISDPELLDPAPEQAGYLINRAREEGVLLSVDGPDRNVIKIKPPMVFTQADAERLVRTVDTVLGEL